MFYVLHRYFLLFNNEKDCDHPYRCYDLENVSYRHYFSPITNLKFFSHVMMKDGVKRKDVTFEFFNFFFGASSGE